MKKTFIIAEAGANHNKDLAIAKQLVRVARDAGCDAVKFQTYSSETLYSKNTPDFAGYQNINDLIKSIELPREWQKILKDYCDGCGIEFMSTPFDEAAVDQLVELGVKRFKIAGFESTDPRFVKYVASKNLPIVFSCGIGSNCRKAEETFEWIRSVGNDKEIWILHCNNAYPTPISDINLINIAELEDLFDMRRVKIGLSDHTMNPYIPAMAIMKGAQVIEKHFTLSRSLKGPDHPFALEPRELYEMVKQIRVAEKAIGCHKTSLYTQSEEEFKQARRSVVARKAIPAGTILTEALLTTKRPFISNAISAELYYKMIGKTLLTDLQEDDILKVENIR
jgi:N-acetylneuraminate synthase/N,N'-diacetyllegionaminate synthase